MACSSPTGPITQMYQLPAPGMGGKKKTRTKKICARHYMEVCRGYSVKAGLALTLPDLQGGLLVLYRNATTNVSTLLSI